MAGQLDPALLDPVAAILKIDQGGTAAALLPALQVKRVQDLEGCLRVARRGLPEYLQGGYPGCLFSEIKKISRAGPLRSLTLPAGIDGDKGAVGRLPDRQRYPLFTFRVPLMERKERQLPGVATGLLGVLIAFKAWGTRSPAPL